MSTYCRFDQLPAELLHILFTYFSAHEILFTFSDISDYMNGVLLNHTAYRLNFKSIRRSHFDIVCCHIRAEQILSLTLCDDNDTPGQAELFLSRFPIEQLTQLRSLTLIKIEDKSFKYIFSNLHKLIQLCSLSFDDESIRYPYPSQIDPVHHYLTDLNVQLLSSLNRLSCNDGATLLSIPFPYLRHLNLTKCSNNELISIVQHASRLKSLSACTDIDQSGSKSILPSNQLTHLSLQICDSRMSIKMIKEFLSNSPYLKHLELIGSVWNNVADGYLWQKLAISLITFNFKFDVLSSFNPDTLHSFQTPFWIEEKHWFVIYQNNSLFSIPHFLPTEIDFVNLSRFCSIVPDHSIVVNHLNEFAINTNVIKSDNHYLPHVKTLHLKCVIPFQTLESVMNLNQVEHLHILSLDKLLMFIPLKYTMPKLCALSIKNNVTSNMIENMRYYRFEQILKLEICISSEHSDYILEELFLFFPNIQRLKYMSSIHSIQSMVHMIDGFKYLSNASFYIHTSFINRESKCCQNTDIIIQQSQRLIKNNFTCRIYYSSYGNSLCNWWINEHPSTRRGYYWYRFKHILSSILYHNYPSIISTLIYLANYLIFYSFIISVNKSSDDVYSYYHSLRDCSISICLTILLLST